MPSVRTSKYACVVMYIGFFSWYGGEYLKIIDLASRLVRGNGVSWFVPLSPHSCHDPSRITISTGLRLRSDPEEVEQKMPEGLRILLWTTAHDTVR